MTKTKGQGFLSAAPKLTANWERITNDVQVFGLRSNVWASSTKPGKGRVIIRRKMFMLDCSARS